MKVQQFYDEGLAHGSYAIVSEEEVALVDPGRDPKPYLEFAHKHGAKVVAVLETHPHADFASSHLEFHQKHGATIYVNPKAGVTYPHQPVEDGDEIPLGRVHFKTLFTPGHSPDHNSYLLLDEEGHSYCVFTGDSLFVGDVGRPDLREGAGKLQVQRANLAGMMYRTLKDVFKPLPNNVLVYPAHGAGSLCGKNMRSETFSTIGTERAQNWAMQLNDERTFVEALLEDQPFVPKYFPYDVEINRTGVNPLEEAVKSVPRPERDAQLDPACLIVDSRPQDQFKKGHLPGAINLQDGPKFETWLGTIIGPDEHFYLIAENREALETVIRKAAKIGYEKFIKGALMNPASARTVSQPTPVQDFKAHPEKFTIIDIRNRNEYAQGALFRDAHNIPLPELRERISEIPRDKPVVVHCAGGYRSAAGASIIQAGMENGTAVYDLSETINDFKNDTVDQ